MDTLFPRTLADLTTLARAAGHLLYPHTCAGCGSVTSPDAHPLCPACRATVRPALFPGPPPHVVLGTHEGPLRTVVRGLKCGKPRSMEAVSSLASLLGHLVGRAFAEADALLAVPTSPHALLARGFNPARVVAEAVACASGLPLLPPDVVVKSRETAKQAFLPFLERHHNVAGAFDATPAVRDLRLVVVDDVLTTGATLEAVSMAVRQVRGKIFGAAFLSRRPLFVECLQTAPREAVRSHATKLRP